MKTGWIPVTSGAPRNIYIRLPTAIWLRSYTLEATSDGSGGIACTEWVLYGSTDGATWTAIDSRTAVNFWPVGDSAGFTTNSTDLYQFYRLSSSSFGAIGEWRLFGISSASASEKGLNVYPPGPLVNFQQNTLSGYPDGNGDYRIDVSSAIPSSPNVFSGGTANGLFDKTVSYFWRSAGPYTDWGIPGGRYFYSGSVMTSIYNMGYMGEWVQLTVPKAIVPTLLVVTTASSVLLPLEEQSFLFGASNDGVTWTQLNVISSRLTGTASGVNCAKRSYFNITETPLSSYSAFRLVVLDPGLNMTTYYVSVADMEIYGYTSRCLFS